MSESLEQKAKPSKWQLLPILGVLRVGYDLIWDRPVYTHPKYLSYQLGVTLLFGLFVS